MLVHVSLTDVAVDIALHEDLHHVLRLLNHKSGQILDVDAGVLIPQFEPGRLFIEQVANLLIVNLKVARTHQILLLRVRLDLGEDVLERPRHDTLIGSILSHARDRECLACSCLSVGENRAIIALDDVLADREGRLSEDFLLLRAAMKE